LVKNVVEQLICNQPVAGSNPITSLWENQLFSVPTRLWWLGLRPSLYTISQKAGVGLSSDIDATEKLTYD